MGATDMAPKLREMVVGHLGKLAMGEDYDFDLGPVMIPGPQGILGGYLLMLSRRSPVLKPAWIASSWAIPDGHPTDEIVKNAVISVFAQVNAQYQMMLHETPA